MDYRNKAVPDHDEKVEFDTSSPFPYFQSQESRDALEREYEPTNVE